MCHYLYLVHSRLSNRQNRLVVIVIVLEAAVVLDLSDDTSIDHVPICSADGVDDVLDVSILRLLKRGSVQRQLKDGAVR